LNPDNFDQHPAVPTATLVNCMRARQLHLSRPGILATHGRCVALQYPWLIVGAKAKGYPKFWQIIPISSRLNIASITLPCSDAYDSCC